MKENIKLVLVDIDGTLLNDQLVVTEETKKAISKLKEHDVLFGIATGRTPYAVRHLVKKWGIAQDCDLIMGFNGGSTLYLKSDELESCYLIKCDYLSEARNDFKDFNVNYGIYDKESYHCQFKDQYADMICERNNLPQIVEDLSVYNGTEMEKMLMMGDPKEIDRAVEYFKNNIQTDHYKAVRSAPTLLEFINPELSKSKGIDVICQKLGITKENVLTFGDESNDFEMIRDCVGVAMGNAIPKLKEVARYITKTNNEDGIAVFLNENILNK